jgi:carbonic anhydrase
MRLSVGAMLTLCGACAAAAQWVDIASPEALMMQFDTASVVREGDVARAWDKVVHPRDQSIGSGDTAYRSVLTLTGYHCVRRNSLPLARVFFTEDGRELLRTNAEGLELSQPVVPDSPRSRMLELACAKQARGESQATGDAVPVRSTPPGAVESSAAQSPRPAVEPKPPALSGKPGADREAREAGTTGKNDQAAQGATPRKAASPPGSQEGKGDARTGAAGDEASPSGGAKSAKPQPAVAPQAQGKSDARTAMPTEAQAVADKGAPRAPAMKVRWTYEGKLDGPAAWHKLDPDFQLCAQGQRQSPIDIRDSVRLQIDGLRFDYKPFPLRIVDNGRTVQVTAPPGNTMILGTRSYELLQFHFHKPSEERIAGKVYEMAAHFVHKSKDGRTAVLAVMFSPGPDHPVIQTLWNHLPLEAGRDEEITGVKVDLQALLPRSRGYFTYMGSLTTPPCTEGVQWVVLKTPVPISRGQVNVFSKLYGMNARPLQPAHGRLIKETL